MYKIYTIENHRAEILTFNGADELKKAVDCQEINFLAVELVDTLEIEN